MLYNTRYAEKGHEIVGIEFVEKACRSFFETYNIDYKVEECKQIEGKLFKVNILTKTYNINAFTYNCFKIILHTCICYI